MTVAHLIKWPDRFCRYFFFSLISGTVSSTSTLRFRSTNTCRRKDGNSRLDQQAVRSRNRRTISPYTHPVTITDALSRGQI